MPKLFLLIEYFEGGLASHWTIMEAHATKEDAEKAKVELEKRMLTYEEPYRGRMYAEIREMYVTDELVKSLLKG